MSWFRLDDGMLGHPKWVRALRAGGSEALHLWVALGTWSSHHLTDGMVPADMLSEIPGPKSKRVRERALKALLGEGLLVQHIDGSVLLHDYLDYNPSRSEVLAERERKAKNQRDCRLGKTVTGDSPVSHHVPSPPVPSRPIPKEREPRARSSTPEVPGLERVGVGKTYSMPSEEPPQAYLDAAVIEAVSVDQARATWRHYFGAGLPAQGVERLHPWLLQRARERANQLARQPKPGAKPVTGEAWGPSARAAEYRDKHQIAPVDWNELIRAHLADTGNAERSLQEQHRVFGQRLANFCRDRDERRSA